MALFSSGAVYHRADMTYAGCAEIETLFRDRRKIRGVHKLDQIWSVGDRVICSGRFDGLGAAGDKRCVGFADFWFFGSDDMVVERRTYLAVGHQHVEA